MTISGGKGDSGLAEDLLPLAEVDLEPRVDWDPVVSILARLEDTPKPSTAERTAILAEARAVAAGHAGLNRLIDTYEKP